MRATWPKARGEGGGERSCKFATFYLRYWKEVKTCFKLRPLYPRGNFNMRIGGAQTQCGRMGVEKEN